MPCNWRMSTPFRGMPTVKEIVAGTTTADFPSTLVKRRIGSTYLYELKENNPSICISPAFSILDCKI